MAEYKTKFELGNVNKDKMSAERICGEIEIIGEQPERSPYVTITLFDGTGAAWIQDKDLERFARNILKSLGKK